MKKLIGFFTILIAYQGCLFAQGSTYKAGEFIQIAGSDSIQSQVLAAGQTIDMLGWLGNDFFAAAELLTIDGTVTDDAIVAGRRITVRGTVGDLLMGAGETILIDGVIDGDLFAAGREVRIVEGARIRGNAFIAAASVLFEGGTIDGVLRAAGEELQMNGAVDSRADLYGHEFTFGPDYMAANGTNITSDQPVYRENLGHIPENLNIVINEPDILPVILFKAGFYISMLLTGLVLLRIFQQTAIDMQRFATERFWKNTGIGLLAFLLVPFSVLVLIFLVFTIPLSIILALLYGLSLLAGYLLVAMILGVMSIFYFRPDVGVSAYYWGLALGMLYIAILVNLPFIGWFLNAILLFFGLGSLVYYLWHLSRSGETAVNTEERRKPIE